MRPSADQSVVRALQLSRELLDAAHKGDMQRVVDLNAERGPLLQGFLQGLSSIGAAERSVLDEIQKLNDQGLACIELRRRETADEFAQLGRGRRAADAYANVQGRGE